MEKITYRLTLDTFKGGIQKVLRGVYTGDVLSRRVAISLSAGSVPCKISDEESSVSAVMYVTKPSGVTNYGDCEIVDNVVYYDIIQYDVDVEGIVEMQLKVMSEDSVLYAPVFALEVQQSKNSDTIAEQSPQFTALEAALAKAEEVYRKRLVSIELTDDLVFIAHYGDNSTYESDAIKNALAFVDDAEKARVIAENERVLAEEQRVLAELERVLAEQRRDSNYDNLWTSLNEVIKDTEELQKYVESLVEEGFITESRVLELIEEHGGGAVPDNVLVASEESAQMESAPKVNADLFCGKTPSDFASAEDTENITNGTTQVGNAKTLDGHGAEYFVNMGEGLATSITEEAFTLSDGVHFYRLGGAYYTGNDLPTSNYAWSFSNAMVLKRNNVSLEIVLFSEMAGRIAIRSYDGSWNEWSEYATTADLANYLPLDGSESITGNKLELSQRRGAVYCDDAHIELKTRNGIGNDDIFRCLLLLNNFPTYGRPDVKNALVLRDRNGNVEIDYTILHTGNKPTGTYTGNGSATARQINTGGIGGVIVIWSINGGIAFANPVGCYAISGDGTSAFLPNVTWVGGNLSLATDSPFVNSSGTTFQYTVL